MHAQVSLLLRKVIIVTLLINDIIFPVLQRPQFTLLPLQEEYLEPLSVTKRSKEEYYSGSSKVIQETEEGAVTVRSDRQTKLYNRFR